MVCGNLIRKGEIASRSARNDEVLIAILGHGLRVVLWQRNRVISLLP